MKLIYKVYRFLHWKFANVWDVFRSNAIKLGYRDKRSILWMPSAIVGGDNVYLYEYTRLQGNHTILSYKAKFIMKKYSAAAVGLIVVTGNHVPTVGIPQYLLGSSHINDREEDVIVEEDVWIGANVTLLAGAHIGRGCIVGAGSVITHKSECPPYSVIVGCPSRVIAAKFTINQILEHERKLYKPEERLKKEELETIFNTYYKGKRTLGIDYNLSLDEERRYEKLMKDMHFTYPL